MKKFKKVITLATASLMAVSVGMFSACGDDYGSQASNEAAEKIIKNLSSQDSQSITLDGKMTQGLATTKVSANVNYGAGNADIFASENNAYHYMFIRDWKVYTAEDSKTEIKDFSSVPLKLGTDLKAAAEEELGEMTDLVFTQIPAFVNGALSAYNSLIISFAKAANAVAYKNNTLTVNYNLAFYNMYNDTKSVVDGLKITTTVGDLLGNNTIKKYMQVLTEFVTVDEINTAVDLVKGMLESTPEAPEIGVNPVSEVDEDTDLTPENPETPDYTEMMQTLGVIVEAVDGLLDAVKADANSTTYDYLLKLLSSEELKELINSSVGEEVLAKKLSEYSVGDLLSLIVQTNDTTVLNAMLKQVKDAYAQLGQYITAKAITVEGTSISDVLITYTVDENFKVLSQTFASKVKSDGGMVSEEFTITYNKTAVTLKTVTTK